MSFNYYEQLLQKLDVLMASQKYAAAYKIIVEELSMPYVPQDYEAQLKQMLLKIKDKIEAPKPHQPKTLDQVLDMLFSPSVKMQNIALELLKNHNLRPIQSMLKKRFETFASNVQQALLFETMSLQEINIDLTIKNLILNPIKDSLFTNQEVKKALQTIQECSSIQPQVKEGALGEIYKYLLITFPDKPKKGATLATDIIAIVQYLITHQGVLTTTQSKILAQIQAY